MCAGAATPSECVGWQQGVYSSVVNQSGLYIEYWLLHYNNPSCPNSHWTYSNGSCALNTNSVTGVWTNVLGGDTPVPVTSLSDISMSMTAGSRDTITMAIGDNVWSAQFSSLLGLDLAPSWTSAEFGIFGDDGGDEADFNAGTTIEVQLATNSVTPTSAAPMCSMSAAAVAGGTGETNSLSLVPHCCLAAGQSSSAATPPSITFLESNIADLPCSLCGAEGQAPRNEDHDGAWCASPGDISIGGGNCQPRGGTGEPCCADSACTTAGDTCQLSICGPGSVLTASPSILSVQQGDGTSGFNTAVTVLEASGLWTDYAPALQSVSYEVFLPTGGGAPGQLNARGNGVG